MTATVAFNELYDRYAKELDGSVANKVLAFITKMQKDPTAPGLDLKTPAGVTDKHVKTARVDDFWRAVLLEVKPGAHYAMICVKPHDDAYTFAGNLALNVNEASGALEIYDTVAVTQAVESTPRVTDGDGGHASLLARCGVKVKDLHKFGISESLANAVMGIGDQDSLLEFVDVLPKNLQNVLLDLAEGRSVEQVWADHVGELTEPVDTNDVAAAAVSPASRVMFTDGSSEEIRAVLEGSLAKWRVWLHPSQRALAYHDGWNGPARVTGGAGTGKTVTALHRAKYLAEKLASQPSGEKVLVTTFTRNLAREVQSQLVQLAGPLVTDRVDVINIDSLVYRTLSAIEGSQPVLVGATDAELQSVIEVAIPPESGLEPGFVTAEWSYVVLAQGLGARDEYLKASRAGRGRRLSKPQRAQVWAVIEQAQQYLSQQGKMTYTQAASRAAGLLSQRKASSGAVYRHAVIDEAQDLHPAHWRLLRALIPEGTDDLFIAGDAHQRIYGRPSPLSWYGINIRGRSRRLTVNYRTSRQILAWCLGVTKGEPVDDLDGDEETLAGARSEFTGPVPETLAYQTAADERAGLSERLRGWNDDGVDWGDMAVMARSRAAVEDIASALADAGVPQSVVEARTDESGLGGAVRVMTMHRGKGLEYRAVALVGVGADAMPPSYVAQLPDDEKTAAFARERSLLYVAGSRARERLSISWAGKPSGLLTDEPPRAR